MGSHIATMRQLSTYIAPLYVVPLKLLQTSQLLQEGRRRFKLTCKELILAEAKDLTWDEIKIRFVMQNDITLFQLLFVQPYELTLIIRRREIDVETTIHVRRSTVRRIVKVVRIPSRWIQSNQLQWRRRRLYSC